MTKRYYKAIFDGHTASETILASSPKDAGKGLASLGLLLSGVSLLIIAMTILGFYSPTPALSWVYSWLVLPLGLIPMAMAIKLLAGRDGGKEASASRKLLWSSLFNLGVITSVVILLVTSPASSSWIVGDMHARTGNLDKAEDYYLRTLEAMPGNSDVLFCLGQLNRQKEDWEAAFYYLERSYQGDPSNWVAEAAVLLPDTLMKGGRFDEAIFWCDRISQNYPKRIDISRAVGKKRAEIQKNTRG